MFQILKKQQRTDCTEIPIIVDFIHFNTYSKFLTKIGLTQLAEFQFCELQISANCVISVRNFPNKLIYLAKFAIYLLNISLV